MAMTPLPTAPSRSDAPATFISRADAFVAALPGFVTEANTLQSDVTTKQTSAATSATNAATSESNALTYKNAANTSATNAATSESNAAASASAASASATSASNYAAALNATSTTSLLIAVASKTFTTQSGKQFAAGQWVTATSNANSANWMFGQVTSYSGTTLIVNVTVVGGSGTYADWNLSIAGTRGATGATGNGVPANLTLTNPATAATLTIANNGSLITSGAYAVTLTATATTNATLPAGTTTLAQLGANTFTGNQAYGDNQNSRAMFIDCGYVFVDKGNSGTSTQTLDYTAGSHQKITATGNHTIAVSNFPPSGNLGEILLELTNGGAYTVTWPTINWLKPDGTTTTSISTYLAANTGRTSLQSSGTDFVVLWSRDAGTTLYGKLV